MAWNSNAYGDTGFVITLSYLNLYTFYLGSKDHLYFSKICGILYPYPCLFNMIFFPLYVHLQLAFVELAIGTC